MKLRLCALALAAASAPVLANVTVLYTQDFEHPTGFVNDGGDINLTRTVNQLYGNQPSGFQFYQPFTTETLRVGGTAAFGTGYKDPQGRAGQYVVGMLSAVQADTLALSFDIGAYRYLNFQLDISSIDLDRFGGPFVPTSGLAPRYRISLVDNPGGAVGPGSGSVLDFEDIDGLLAPQKNTFNWNQHIVALDATGTVNGHVTVVLDLLVGGYAAFDNFRIAASNTAGNVGQVPEPAGWMLAGLALGVAAMAQRRRKTGITPQMSA